MRHPSAPSQHHREAAPDVWSAPPVAPLHDLLALPSTSGMTRAPAADGYPSAVNLQWFHGPESRPLGSALHAPVWLTQMRIMFRVMCRQHGRAFFYPIRQIYLVRTCAVCSLPTYNMRTWFELWSLSVPSKVAPRSDATRAGWPTGDDRQSRVRAGLSLLLVLPAAPVARPGWRPPGAPWSYGLNAGATSPWVGPSPRGRSGSVVDRTAGAALSNRPSGTRRPRRRVGRWPRRLLK